MRKRFSIFLVMMLVLSLVAVGCGGNEEKTGEAKDPVSEAPSYNLLMATGGTGGTYYPLGGAIANEWNSNIEGLNVTIEATGASVENIRLLGSGESEIAMAMNGPAMSAFEGTGDFEGTPVDFSAVGVIYPEVMQIIAPKDSGIKTVADLAGKRVSIGPAGSGTASAAINILASYGMDPDKDINKFQDNFADAARKIKDGQLDAAFAVLAVPAANVVDITTATEVTIVDIEGEGLANLLAMDPTFSPYEIPAGTYDGQDEVAYTVSQWAVLYVSNDLPDDLVYDMTRIMYDNNASIARTHARGDQILLETATLGIDPVPFHPGAIRYYQEKGIK